MSLDLRNGCIIVSLFCHIDHNIINTVHLIRCNRFDWLYKIYSTDNLFIF